MNKFFNNDYETKVVSDIYDSVDKKMSDFGIYKKSSKDEFSNFITKVAEGSSFNSVFSIKNSEDFFFNLPDFYNPLRDVANVIKTFADSLEIPSLGTAKGGWGTDEAVAADNVKPSVNIRCHPVYATREMDRGFLKKTSVAEEYIKNLIATKISALERKVFIDGDGQNKPLGLFAADSNIEKKNLNTPRSEVAADKHLANLIQEMPFDLKPEYRREAHFVISSTLQKKIFNIKSDMGEYIFKEGKLFGYNVLTLDELTNAASERILFGNFKLGFTVVDSQESELKVYDMFDKPHVVGFGLTNHTGAATTLPEAIKGYIIPNAILV